MGNVESKSRREMEWLDIRTLREYAAVSERTIREWIHRPNDPLPAVQVGKKILVRRSDFDQWLGQHPLRLANSINISGMVNAIMSELTES